MATTNNIKSDAFNRNAVDMFDETERELYVTAVQHCILCEMNEDGIVAAHAELQALDEMLLADGWERWVLEIAQNAVWTRCGA